MIGSRLYLFILWEQIIVKKRIICASFILTLLLSAQTLASSYYGPTIANDRLYRIALALQPSTQVDVQQVMVGIYKHNSYAFIGNNLNGLYAGILLYIPSLEQIAQIDTSYAHDLIKKHNIEWQTIHPKLAQAKQSTEISSNNVSTILRSYTSSKQDQLIMAEPSLNNNNVSSYVNNAVSLQHEYADAAKEQQNSVINLETKHDDEHTIFTSLDEDDASSGKETIVVLADVDVKSAEVKKPLNVTTGIKASDLHEMQQQLAVLQLQLGKLLVKLKEQQHVEPDVKPELQNKYALFDNSKLNIKNDASDYGRLFIDADTAYIEWLLAAIMSLVTFGLIITGQRENLVKAVVDIEDDEYDYIGSSDGIPMKLNLAKAYCEMGHDEKAKKTLAEVVAKGNHSQKIEAKNLLAEIEQNEG
jgi:FimV-like protein